ncbi:mercuric transporter MerT family protein [Sphingomonas sp.]|uniref:mercuric transporter MerT family protein n=1 Tax=Sphingomonas sp. TaxID=28214 RepID=UPI001858223D|nr:mercuric transporter MerT family protein [Sphingomonas sp.]MBA3511121.1 mercuric reductase [Sphingomonas sp.]
MSNSRIEIPLRTSSAKGPLAFSATGLAAAFGVASCCALPLLLASAGIGTAWLGTFAAVASPIRPILLLVATFSLAVAAVLVWRQERAIRTCDAPACGRRFSRTLSFVAIGAGSTLLGLGYIYG